MVSKPPDPDLAALKAKDRKNPHSFFPSMGNWVEGDTKNRKGAAALFLLLHLRGIETQRSCKELAEGMGDRVHSNIKAVQNLKRPWLFLVHLNAFLCLVKCVLPDRIQNPMNKVKQSFGICSGSICHPACPNPRQPPRASDRRRG